MLLVRVVAIALLALFLASCSDQNGGPPGGMAGSASSSADTSSETGPGFLSPTPPAGGGGGPVTPPPGGIGATTPTATPPPSVTSTPTARPTAKGGTPEATTSATSTPTPAAFETPTPEPTDTPVPVANNGGGYAVYVTMQAPPTVQRGGAATIQATTTVPGALCTLSVHYRTGGSAPPQFPVQTADANGHVEWTWTVASDVVAGDWPVSVRCQLGQPLGDPNRPFGYANNLLPVR